MNKQPERSVEEIVEEYDGLAFTISEAKDWLRKTLQAERQKREEVVEEAVKKVNDIATQNGYALAIKHFEERIQKGQPIFEAIDGMKNVHRKRQALTNKTE